MKSIIILAALFSVFGSASAQQEATLNLHDGREIKGFIKHITADSVFITQPHEIHYADRVEALPVLAFSRRNISTVVFPGSSGVLGSTLIGMGVGALTSSIIFVTDRGDGSMEGLRNILGAMFIASSTVLGGIGGLTYGLLAGRSDTTFDMSDDSDFDLLRKAYGNAVIARK
jgi:hypothetical protein